MHPEITCELMRAHHEELARQGHRLAARHAATRPRATTDRTRRRFRWALRHARA